MTDGRCICGDLEPAHARIHCPVHGLFAGLTREQLRERADAAEAELARLREERDVALRYAEKCVDEAVAAVAECARLQQALREARRGLPDAMHPGIPKQFVDGLVAAQIVIADALGDEDPGNVEAAREALAGSDTPADRMEFVWLIERVHEGSPVWLQENATWTSDARLARRFDTREAAQRVIAATRSEAVAVEHGFADTPADSPEPREGIVMVYDWEHRYLGCMGIERWQEILDADRREPMPEACPRCGCLTYKLVNNSLHMDAPDGAVICDNCGKGWVHSTDEHGLIRPADSQEDEWFIPDGDRQCGVVHKMARATCMKRRGHDGSHATPQGTWIDGPWCEYPADSQEDKT